MEKLVLLVEDDEAVAEYLSTVLQAQGFEVSLAGDVETAEAILEAHGHQLAFMVTDGMGPRSQPGLALAQKAHALNPALPVILVSGNLLPENWRESPAERFLPKPFTSRELLTTIQDLAPDVPR